MADITLDLTENIVQVTLNTISISDSFTMAQIQHSLIQEIGTNSHAEIDTFINSAEATTEQSVRSGALWSPAKEILSEGIWDYSTNTTMTDPGAGNVRLNNVDLSLATKAVINKISNQGVDFSSVLDALTVGSILNLREYADVGNYIVSEITSLTDNGTWIEADVSIVGASSFSGDGVDTIIRILSLSDNSKLGNNLEVLLASSSQASSQQPSGTDAPLQVEFGVAMGSPSTPIEMDALGNITFNQIDNYFIRVAVHFGRTGSSGTSELRLRSLVNGVQIGETIGISISSSNEVIYDSVNIITRPSNIGDVLTFEVMRDSSGNNSGGLFQLTVTPVDWTDAPSSRLLIQRFT